MYSACSYVIMQMIDDSAQVWELKKAIKAEKPNDFKDVDADKLHHFLAKKDGAWLESKDLAVIAIRIGGVPKNIKALLDVEMDPVDELGDFSGDTPTKRTIHVLVVSDRSSVAIDSPLSSAVTHSENRRKRWRELNKILDKNKKAKTIDVDSSSTGLFVDVKLEVKESVDINEVTQTEILGSCSPVALIGCEVVADREGPFVVYDIVTGFMKWQIYRCGENSILLESSTLGAKSEELDTGSMRDVCEMIYGALSDHEEECKKE
ncbi:CRN-like protein [Plasmopara halstedii]|uniref:CRN-like protein n=1 Tax=Plasmopara halstedii TaxID=4781 RepID=A0A0P1ALW6_PLAHL|nr:CRN-like protein [Plasmopara halstedii]CEG41709.1 CRN-like protein [Plasmopara halstedii]|eukprot:XP_024578078.1 CRN-like protein [Plasmopara halstedii]